MPSISLLTHPFLSFAPRHVRQLSHHFWSPFPPSSTSDSSFKYPLSLASTLNSFLHTCSNVNTRPIDGNSATSLIYRPNATKMFLAHLGATNCHFLLLFLRVTIFLGFMNVAKSYFYCQHLRVPLLFRFVVCYFVVEVLLLKSC